MHRPVTEDNVRAARVEGVDFVVVGAVDRTRPGVSFAVRGEAVGDKFVVAVGPAAAAETPVRGPAGPKISIFYGSWT